MSHTDFVCILSSIQSLTTLARSSSSTSPLVVRLAPAASLPPYLLLLTTSSAQALGDLNRSAEMGNADAKKLLLSMSKNAEASNGSRSTYPATGNNNGGFYHSPANSNPSSANNTGAAGVKVPGEGARTTTARAAAEAAAARRRASGAAALQGAARNDGGGSGNGLAVRLEARPGARAGEELSFGGKGSDSPYGVRFGGRDGAQVGVGNGAVSGAYSGGEDGGVGGVSGTPRRRRPRPRPGAVPLGGGSGSANGGKVLTTSTNLDEDDPSVAGEERDTFPAPHPALTHPSVRRCFVGATGPAGVASRAVGCDAGERAPTVVSPRDSSQMEEIGGRGGDRVDIDIPDRGNDDEGAEGFVEGVPEVPGGTGEGRDAHNGQAESETPNGGRKDESGGGSGDDGSRDRGAQGREPTEASEASEVSGVGPAEAEGPPPATQAKLVRWLVEQEKDKKVRVELSLLLHFLSCAGGLHRARPFSNLVGSGAVPRALQGLVSGTAIPVSIGCF